MKKLLAFFCVAVLALPLAFSEIAFGARALGEWGVGTDVSVGDAKLDLAKSWDFGGAAFARFSIPAAKNLFVQPELGFLHSTTGMKYTYTDSNGEKTTWKSTLSYNALILPVLVGYGFPVNQNFTVFLEGGPQVSFLLGDLTWKSDDDDDGSTGYTPKSRVLFSGVFGAGVTYSFSPSVALLGDLRYDLGFVKARPKDVDAGIIPRGVSLSAGFLVRF